MRVIYVLVMLFVVSSCSYGDIPDKRLYTECIYPVVKLSLSDNSGGSGVIVRSSKNKDNKFTNIILTAAHVTRGPLIVGVPKLQGWETIDYNDYKCHLISSSSKYDLAILVFETDTPMYTAHLDFESKFFIGSKVVKMGYGSMDDCRMDCGEITSLSFLKKDMLEGCIRTNASTTFGDSGGPCYLRSSYGVIGIMRAIRIFGDRVLTDHSFACPITNLRDWSKELSNELDYTFNMSTPIPFDALTIEKRNTVNNLTEELNLLQQEITVKSLLIDSIKEHIKSIEENGLQEIAPKPPEE